MPLSDLNEPRRLDLRIRAGDSFARALAIQEADGSATDLTGLTPRAQVRDRPGGSLLAEFVAALVGDPANGIVSYALSAAQTRSLAALEPGMVWDLELDGGDTNTTTVVAGTVTVCPDVTVAV